MSSSRPSNPQQRRRRSLSARFVVLVVAFVILTGLALGAAAALAGLRNSVAERRQSLEYAATVVAASLIPVIADQDSARIEAQIRGLLDIGATHEIECILVTDASGEIMAESAGGCTCGEIDGTGGLLSVFTEPQSVNVPVEIDGLKVADVSVQFNPVGLEAALMEPLQVTALVLVLSMIVTASWGGWIMMRTVVEPIAELKDAAAKIADGNRELDLDVSGSDEIGQLALALREMTEQLARQEAELRSSYSSLEIAYEGQAELAQRLERTMRMKSDFVAVASHELRSPLAVIRLYAEMIEEQEFGDLDPELVGAVEAIVSAVSRLSSIVSSLMDVALLERGLMPLEYRDVALDEIVEQAVADAGVVAARSGLSVANEEPVPAVVLRADEVRLRQVLDNLLSNAIKYSPPDGTVTVAVEIDDAEVRVSVKDEGPGVPESHIDVLFEPFSRAVTSDDAPVSGIGLGLTISMRIARAHGGGIRYSSGPGGRGATFTLWLPKSGAPRNAAPSAVDVMGRNAESV